MVGIAQGLKTNERGYRLSFGYRVQDLSVSTPFRFEKIGSDDFGHRFVVDRACGIKLQCR